MAAVGGDGFDTRQVFGTPVRVSFRRDVLHRLMRHPVALRELRSTILVVGILAGCSSPQPCPVAAPPASPASHASAAVAPITFGQSFHLRSSVLGEDRVINVYLPPGYSQGDARYPVLYALDGGMQEDFPHVAGIVDVSIKNEVIRPMLVVGIENTERRRDLVGPTSIEEERKIAPHAGGTDRFRRFIREELKPEVARRYRAVEESAVIGESFAGLFVVETLLQDASLFDTYIAIDPSVWWNGGALVKSAHERFASWSGNPKRLFVATADYKETQDRVAELIAAFDDSKPAGLVLMHEPFPAEHHSTVFPVAEVRAYRALFPAAHM
jgi:predicted alpha/beta superfamily hydrolase